MSKIPGRSRRSLLAPIVSMAVLAAAGVIAVDSAKGAGRGRGAAPTPKPTIVAPDADKGDSTKTHELPTVYSQENTGANYPAPTLPTLETATTVIKPFPDPFAWANDPLGKTRSTDFKDWEHHRAEMMAMIEKYEIGAKPAVNIQTQVKAEFTLNAPATAPAEGSGAANAPVAPGGAGGVPGGGRGRGRGGPTGGPGSGTLVVTMTANGQSVTMSCPVLVPVGAKAPYPILIGIGGGSGSLPGNAFSTRGIATVAFQPGSMTQDGRPTVEDPFFKLFPDQKFSSRTVNGDTGQYVAWSWGISRLIDGLSLVQDKLPVDMKHIAITGCSRWGKLALFGGAFDERIALTLAQESGGGGATNWRFSQTEPPDPTDATGKKLSVEGITNTDHAWFKAPMFDWGKDDNLAKLPEDHHMLAALVAPRALYVTGNTDYTWLSNPSMYVNSRAAAKVYSTLGIADRFGYVVNGQHGHCQFPASQEPDLAYFLDRFMLDKTDQSKIVANVPEEFAKIDYARWTNWWGTGNPELPALKEGAWK